jgi:hypothetical protein
MNLRLKWPGCYAISKCTLAVLRIRSYEGGERVDYMAASLLARLEVRRRLLTKKMIRV